MISETSFAANYTSIWRTLTPLMDEFVRRMNTEGYDRTFTPLASEVEPARRGIVNEAAFLLFKRGVQRRESIDDAWFEREFESALLEAERYISGESTFRDTALYSNLEKDEVSQLVRRLRTFFLRGAARIEVDPVFKGCGLIKSCYGDVLANGTDLFEVKAGDRPFRSVDYRQIIIYLTLHWAAEHNILATANMLNPRTGVHIGISVERLAVEVSGQSAIEFFERVSRSFSMNMASG